MPSMASLPRLKRLLDRFFEPHKKIKIRPKKTCQAFFEIIFPDLENSAKTIFSMHSQATNCGACRLTEIRCY